MWEHIAIPGGALRLAPRFLAPAEATRLQALLNRELDWQRDRVRVFGRSHLIPRLHQWYGDAGATYRWSGLQLQPLPWTAALARLRDQVADAAGQPFNAVLANLYRDGRDSMGWHADNEAELGSRPVIASLSLGAERDFLLRPAAAEKRRDGTLRLSLPHGSLLLMAGDTQRNWQHALPRRQRVHAPRINLTFRYVVADSP